MSYRNGQSSNGLAGDSRNITGLLSVRTCSVPSGKVPMLTLQYIVDRPMPKKKPFLIKELLC